MSFKYTVRACLDDIIENAGLIEEYTVGMDRAVFERDRRTRDAVERCLERICEAAHRLGVRAAELMPDQNWANIRGMGNWMRHGYERISLEIVWFAVREHVPSLAADASRALATLP